MNKASHTFGQAAAAYASARPTYPAALFDWLAEVAPRRGPGEGNVWDVGTGNGQAALDLAARFSQVYATDFSAAQIAAAKPAPNITYAVAPAESTALADGWADLITVANALHWFDFARFWPEVKRVGAKEAAFAAWGYNWMRVSERFDAEVVSAFRAIIAPFWAANNRINWDGYRDTDIQFPFTRIAHPDFVIRMPWTFHQVMAFMQTWSAFRLSRENAGAVKAMDALTAKLEKTYGGDEVYDVRMPLVMVAGRV